MMKRILMMFYVVLGLAMFSCGNGCGRKSCEQASEGKCGGASCFGATAGQLAGITKAVEYYIDGGRKGDSRITRQAFAQTATMSWCENGVLKSVPIRTLYDIVDASGPATVFYEMTSCSVADDVAVVRIESNFGEAKYSDMFTLVKDGDDWKILSKVYHKKP